MPNVSKSSDLPTTAKITEITEILQAEEEIKTEENVKKQPEQPKSNPTADHIAVLQKNFNNINNECIQAKKESDIAKDLWIASKDLWHTKLQAASNAQGALLSFKLSIMEQAQVVLLKKLSDAGISLE